MIVMLVHVHVTPGEVEPFRLATLDNALHSRREPGVERFDLIQQQDDPTRFILIEAYRTPEAVVSHKETDHYQRWREAVAPLMAEPRVGVKYQADAAGWAGPGSDAV